MFNHTPNLRILLLEVFWRSLDVGAVALAVLFGVGEEVWNFLVEREGGQDTERRAEDDDALCAIELRESGNDGRQHEQ